MSSPPTESQRVHYLDNLRALAMLLGVYLHGALAYAEPSRSVWLATDRRGSMAIDASIWWIHLFRMSLFFLLSGYFAKLLIERRGHRAFIWNRGIRLALPFLLFYPPLWVGMMIVLAFAVSYVEQPEGLLQYIIAAGQNPEAVQATPTWSTMHLWFLYYLLMFSAIAVAFSRFTRRIFLRLGQLLNRKWLLASAPLALVPGIFGGGLPVAAPESFVPTWWPFLFYGLFYLGGWLLFGHEDFLDQLQPYCWWMALASTLLFVPYYWLLPVLDIKIILTGQSQLSAGSYLVECVLTAYLAVLLTITSLLIGQRFLARSNAWLKFCADSSYWVYLIHLPVVLFLQTLLIPVPWVVWGKLCVVTIGAWLFCVATYLVFVRYTPIGWMLNGRRTFP
ncbi:MAG TPA: acyltransferase family protein [Pirellulaceae bacterium]|nr:acyltransferase family protein [Pirellulaceae bacterium]